MRNLLISILLGAIAGCEPPSAHVDPDAFSFAVFGDLNSGGCPRNERFHRLVGRMRQSGAQLYIHTGDIIDGDGDASCFAGQVPGTPCVGTDESGDMAAQLAPLMTAPLPEGLAAAFFPIMGNHDGNWVEQQYPDPCGRGICDLLAMDTQMLSRTYLDHGALLSAEGYFPHVLNHGDPCSTDPGTSGHPVDFYYSFSFKDSLFIALYLAGDDPGMLSCDHVPAGYASCGAFCSDPGSRLDPERNTNCYNVYQWDWLSHTLEQSAGRYAHVFVFGHAPLLGSGAAHGATADARYYRELLERHGVDAYFNGHNHAYERTYPVNGDDVTSVQTGTVYVTVGPAGAITDTIYTDRFTAYSYLDWTGFDDHEQMTTYLLVTVVREQVTVEVVTLRGETVDRFEL